MSSKEKSENTATVKAARINRTGVIIAAVITAIGAVVAGVFILVDQEEPPVVNVNLPTQNLPISSPTDLLPTLADTETSSSALVATQSPPAMSTPVMHVCKPVDSSQPFPVIPNYSPSGLMGDTGDIPNFWMDSQVAHFEYETNGAGPHEWDYKYIDGVPNENPAKFGAIMFLDPPNNWGTDTDGGYDLRNVRNAIRWEARSIGGEVNVEFLIGGVRWAWNNETKAKESVPYPDSMPHRSLGVYTVTEEWQPFSYSLAAEKESFFSCVLGGFGIKIDWGSRGMNQKYIIEVRNVYYEK